MQIRADAWQELLFSLGAFPTIRNLNYTHPLHRPFWGRMVSFTPIPSTGVKDTTPVYKPFWGRHVLFKFRNTAGRGAA